MFDIGAHNGCDTAYYLHKGFRVVAVEANPVLAENIRQSFKQEIDTGVLCVECVGIARTSGIMKFWICDEKSEWSSFNKENAARRGYAHHSVDVQCVTIKDLFERHGLPWYMKVDIEGHDKIVVDQIDADLMPEYISVESYEGVKSIHDLHRAGYRHFKVVDQLSFCTIEIPSTIHQWMFWQLWEFRERSNFDKSAIFSRAMGKFGGRKVAEMMIQRYRSDKSFVFDESASGPLPELVPGHWVDELKAVNALQKLLDKHSGGRDPFSRWFDIHAKK